MIKSHVAKPNNIGQNNFKVKKLFELSTISKFIPLTLFGNIYIVKTYKLLLNKLIDSSDTELGMLNLKR